MVLRIGNTEKALTFSKDGGFYEREVTLKLKAPKGATIYYTTDGTVPTEQSKTYKKPLKLKDRSPEPNVLSAKINVTFTDTFKPKAPIAKGTVVRAFAKYKNGKQSDVITKTYFIGKDFCKKYKDIPVFSLSVNPEDLYDKETGIYVKGKVFDDWVANGGDAANTPTWEMPANFTQTGRAWEKPVHVELFEKEKVTSFTQNMGLRIIGGASRSMEQKSFKLYARKDYGQGSVHYELFPGDTKNVDRKTKLDQYDTFVLRNGGNDSWLTKFRHRYIQLLVADRAPCVQETRPCIVFLNGEYWGIYTMTDDAMSFDPKEIEGSQITLFSNLLKNESFKQQFVTTFMDMVNYNFSKERLNRLLDQMVEEYEPYMPDYYQRFGNTFPAGSILPNPMDAFHTSLNEMKLFLSKRNDYIPKMLKDTLHLKGNAVDVTVNVNDISGGTVTINSITPDFTKGEFKGQYFEDYEITLTAKPEKGYQFKGWRKDADSKESTITVKPGKSCNLEAIFEKKS